MPVHVTATEIVRTYKLHFVEPVFATHPNFPTQELAFTDATVTLAAEWDKRSKTWKPKRTSEGRTPVLELHVPQAKRVKDGYVTRQDAFHINGQLRPIPVRLDAIQKRRWDDDVQDEIRVGVVSAFWDELLGR